MEAKRNRDGFASVWKKKTTHHLTVCAEPLFQTEVESGKRTGGTNTSRFSSSTGAAATRAMREMIEKIVVVNFIVNQPANFEAVEGKALGGDRRVEKYVGIVQCLYSDEERTIMHRIMHCTTVTRVTSSSKSLPPSSKNVLDLLILIAPSTCIAHHSIFSSGICLNCVWDLL